MRRTITTIIPWVIILLPFVILAVLYDSLPAQVMTKRSFLGGTAAYVPKSVFYVFRVPLIEVICGLFIEIMRGRAAGFDTEKAKSYYLGWTLLLYTVAAKSLLQTLEMISSPGPAKWFLYATIAVIAAGVVAAVITGRTFFTGRLRGAWKLGPWEGPALMVLFMLYLVLAFFPV